jgi:hypothetical protein
MNATHCIIPAESVHLVSKLFFFSLQVAVEKRMILLYHLPYSVSPLSMKQKGFGVLKVVWATGTEKEASEEQSGNKTMNL